MRTLSISSGFAITHVLIVTSLTLFAQQPKGSVVTSAVERNGDSEQSMQWIEMHGDETRHISYQIKTDDMGNTFIDYMVTTLGGDNPQASVSKSNQLGALSVCGLQPNSAIHAIPSGNDSLSLFINSDATRIDSIKIVYHNVCGLIRLAGKFASSPGVLIDPSTCTALFAFSCFHNLLDGHLWTVNFSALTVTDTLISRRNCRTICATRQFTLSPVTAIGEALENVPKQFRLEQNYPNPFNPETEIRFQLPKAVHVLLRIFDIKGSEILTLVDAPYAAGEHRVRWYGRDRLGNAVASGVYFYQLQAGQFVQVRKMALVK